MEASGEGQWVQPQMAAESAHTAIPAPVRFICFRDLRRGRQREREFWEVWAEAVVPE